ncbi:hypothetical protein MBT84_38585 [Streptomyces sp. MBT84]|uniref:hypothetical protein n=1 Tax=Streptomyces sp. MBT84 TaxID=1488414 RepID=UPI001D7FB80E|nr:hypothetical protein [Streptomyces sp. MBT84]MBW8705529.1 hypothetical protein [Streptomyces sp. MBT84]
MAFNLLPLVASSDWPPDAPRRQWLGLVRDVGRLDPFLALIITVAVLLFRALNRPQEHTHIPAAPAPEDILR